MHSLKLRTASFTLEVNNSKEDLDQTHSDVFFILFQSVLKFFLLLLQILQ